MDQRGDNMFSEGEMSLATIARYGVDAVALVGQSCRETAEPDLADLPYEVRVADAVRWFAKSSGRWSKIHIRRTAAALELRVELLMAMGDLDEAAGEHLLFILKDGRPLPAKRRKKQGYAKSIKRTDLRRLIAHFRVKDDEFSNWIAGYMLIASRIGWRPGEIFSIYRIEQFLVAPAEKRSNGRGLFDSCEINISSYPPAIFRALDEWIAQTCALVAESGMGRVLSRMNRRIETACRNLGIKVISAYTLRHVAISCMKASGFSPAEIAVIVNHASSRTATERYGKRRNGTRRAKKILRFNNDRLDAVRDNARTYSTRLTNSTPKMGG